MAGVCFYAARNTGNHCPYRIIAPPEGYPDMLRKDLLYAKASGSTWCVSSPELRILGIGHVR